MPKAVIFDLDGTLAVSKQPLLEDMAELLGQLTTRTPVAITSGGGLPQLEKQVASRLPKSAMMSNLYLLPVSGAALYEWRGNSWNRVYEERLSDDEAQAIAEAMREVAERTGIINFSKQAYGERIEFRGAQVSMSALGQQAPVIEKKMWDPNHEKRKTLQSQISELLPDYTVRYGGSTTIDVTKRGIDKAYGIHKLCDRLAIQESDALYVGDELGPGGNDEVVFKTHIETRSVANPEETKELIKELLIAA